MLVEFKVRNFRSFRDEQCLNLTASNISELPKNAFSVAPLDDLQLLRTAVIYGANASGKSNLIRAISTMKMLVLQSSELPESSSFLDEGTWMSNVIPFRLDQQSKNEPTTFEITFIRDNTRYQYGFSVDRERVINEFLIAFSDKSRQRWFDRHPPTNGDDGWSWSEHLKGEKKRIAALTRSDALFLSVAAQLNHQQLSPVFHWFRDQLRIIDVSTNFGITLDTTTQLVHDDSDYHDAVTRAMKAAGLGIDGFEIEKPEERTVKQADGSVRKLIRRPTTIRTFHAIAGSPERAIFDLRRDESLGTRRFFGLIGLWLRALKNAEVVLTDELDASMHPVLTRFLMNLFNDPKLNEKNAQSIVTTHDTTLLDNTLFRRDQVWFTEKDKEAASHLYSLFDFRPRKGEAMQKGYLTGRYGAIPFLGEFSF